MNSLLRNCCALLLGLVLVDGCGGGGQAESSAYSLPVTSTTTLASDVWGIDCEGNHCGASGLHTYSGSGIGAWYYRNGTSANVTVPVEITGLASKRVTLVLTNESVNAVTLSQIALGSVAWADVAAGAPTRTQVSDPAPPSISAENETMMQDLLKNRDAYSAAFARARVAAGASLSQGATRTIIDPYRKQSITVTLRQQVSVPDGSFKVNFWVDNNEFGTGKVTAAVLARFANYFAEQTDNSVYTLVSGLLGKPWGEHGYVNLIDPEQDINIVFYNSNSAGWAGYYANSDQYLQAWYPRSNQWLALYLASEGLYETNASLDGSVRWATSTLAHELTHMIHFYQRVVAMGKGFDTWLNEMAAMSMEDLVDTRVFNLSYSTTQSMHYPNWIGSGNFSCRVDNWIGLGWVNGCNSYAVAGSLGAFLLRQYGVSYYKALFASTQSTSWSILDEAVRSAGANGYQDVMRRWGASLAMLPADKAPSGHGYPRRIDGGFDVMEFDGTSYQAQRQLPATVPSSLAALSHFPWERSGVSGTYKESVILPPGCSLSVVVQ